MKQVVVKNLCKQFQVAGRQPGFVGSLTGLFHRRYRDIQALDGRTLEIAFDPEVITFAALTS